MDHFFSNIEQVVVRFKNSYREVTGK